MRTSRFGFSVMVAGWLVAAVGSAGRAAEPASRAVEDPHKIDLYVGGTGEYPIPRIPSLVVTRSGALLAAIIQQATTSDNSPARVVVRRSTDGGRSWGEVKLVAAHLPNSVNDPSTVVDRSTGRVFLFYASFRPGFHTYDAPPGYTDPNRMRAYMVHSDDDGQTWSEPTDISQSVKRPEVSAAILAPGMGLQLRREPYAGRLVVPMWQALNRRFSTYMAYSDDAGKTWTIGNTLPLPADGQSNESQVVERADGSLFVSARDVPGGLRWTAVSTDGGATWTDCKPHPQLTDPGCMASILRFSDPLDGEKSRILHSNADSKKGRKNGTIRLSYDEGKTWPVSRVIEPNYFGYSALAVLPDGSIGCLYEAENTKKMVFARFSLEWLTTSEKER